jgi:hypothetical protein
VLCGAMASFDGFERARNRCLRKAPTYWQCRDRCRRSGRY